MTIKNHPKSTVSFRDSYEKHTKWERKHKHLKNVSTLHVMLLSLFSKHQKSFKMFLLLTLWYFY